MRKVARIRREVLPTTSTGSRRKQLTPAMIVRIKRLHPLTRSPQLDKRTLRPQFPHSQNHLRGRSLQSNGRGFNNLRRVVW